MQKIERIAQLRDFLRPHRERRLGLVPTMGYLHEGHLSLIRQAAKECEQVVVSVFVNPLQFGPGEDLDRYPRDLERDQKLAGEAGADILFTPGVGEMYPNGAKTTVRITGLTDRLCGASRPGHFDGVATVVSKLFHIVEPDRAYFGQKDAQQVAVIQQMVQDLNFPVEVVSCPTVREADGLAMSSRNVYLSPEERKQAAILYKTLREATREREAGRLCRAAEAVQFIRERLEKAEGLLIDYVEVLSYPELEPLDRLDGDRSIAAVAVRLGSTRLIDNVIWPQEEGTRCTSP
ncbi:pantothenate synthetase [Kroppenstedtia guangzhouensis]|jgi:pantoate--beta-alanine ligase|uniref:Pantothenate synthetase n=1 Tax=Kroppenstedtia guangzhouensis TaxID=1274356 RepID=A0ABQ1G7X7_9BACL|nr:pantoate--beta-alanine ligase [Kroppenstedtia guangzhouensis]GGA38527.1 pantothenate synthetase [Kroppenstedtia guangzhouensis]